MDFENAIPFQLPEMTTVSNFSIHMIIGINLMNFAKTPFPDKPLMGNTLLLFSNSPVSGLGQGLFHIDRFRGQNIVKRASLQQGRKESLFNREWKLRSCRATALGREKSKIFGAD